MFSTTQHICSLKCNTPVKLPTPPKKTPIFALNYGSASLPTTDSVGGKSVTYTGTLSMVNDSTRGYVIRGGTVSNSYCTLPSIPILSGYCSYMFWIFVKTAPPLAYNLIDSNARGIQVQSIASGIAVVIESNYIYYVPYSLGSWIHIAVYTSATTIGVVVNGKLFAYQNSMTNVSHSTFVVDNLNKICSTLTGYNGGDVFMDNFQIYDGTLSLNDIISIYKYQSIFKNN